MDKSRINISNEKEIRILSEIAIQREENITGAGQAGAFLVTYLKRNNLILKFESCGSEYL
jgi:hypothetical protein